MENSCFQELAFPSYCCLYWNHPLQIFVQYKMDYYHVYTCTSSVRLTQLSFRPSPVFHFLQYKGFFVTVKKIKRNHSPSFL